MYIHLSTYENYAGTRSTLPVRKSAAGSPGAHPNLRGGAAARGPARIAVHHPADAFACGGTHAGGDGACARDGQHDPDADAGHHGAARMDLATAGRGPAGVANST